MNLAQITPANRMFFRTPKQELKGLEYKLFTESRKAFSLYQENTKTLTLSKKIDYLLTYHN